MTAQEIIRFLDLKRHQVFSTAIYYLLVPGAVSKMHRLKSDELFHFYLGDPVTWVLLEASKKLRKVVLGNQMQQGQHPQMLVKAGTWFGGSLNRDGQYALMGTTVAPGFEFEDFVLGKPEELLRDFPGAEKEILELT
jgi:predicted cupin superfamily sugar epimerase